MSPTVNPPGVYSSTPDRGPSTLYCRDMTPPVNPPGVYSSAHNASPSTTHRNDYDTADIQPAAPVLGGSSHTDPNSLTGMFQAFRSEMQEMRNVLGQLVQSQESLTTPRGIHREHGNYKLNQPQRPRTDDRNRLMVRIQLGNGCVFCTDLTSRKLSVPR